MVRFVHSRSNDDVAYAIHAFLASGVRNVDARHNGPLRSLLHVPDVLF